MDIISFQCANKNFLFFHNLFFAYRHKLQCKKCYVGLTKKLEDYSLLRSDFVCMAPSKKQLQQCLMFFEPTKEIVMEFESIKNVDEYAQKFIEYLKQEGNKINEN